MGNLRTNDGTTLTYNHLPNECPRCHKSITPEPIYSSYIHISNTLQWVFKCPNQECMELFIGYYKHQDGMAYSFTTSRPVEYTQKEFEEEISNLSPEFTLIFNQAAKAESDQLDKIAGIGFRKALEFLIKDYCVSLVGDNAEEIEKIKKEFLGDTINNRLGDEEIKQIASRATWLGNDETHYTRKWETKDVTDLKTLIDIVQSFISKKLKAKKYIEEMS